MTKSDYRILGAPNIAFATLVPFKPQPRSLGVKFTRRTYLGDGRAISEGPYIELLWSALESEVEYQYILGQAGVANQTYREVTIYCRDQTWQYWRYNGVAIQPQIGVDADWQYFPQNIVLLIRNLVRLP
jgi:hypothetical protein